MALQVAATVIMQWLNSDTSDYSGPAIQCPTCGNKASYTGRRTRTVTTTLGEMVLERAYYHCSGCGHGMFPRDEALNLADTSCSPHVVRSIGVVASMVSFQESSTLLAELAGLAIKVKQVERIAETLGSQVASFEETVTEETPASAPTLYLGMDGTGIPMRPSELEGRSGKQADGSAKTREVKLVTIWSAESRDKEGVPVRDEGSVTYSAAIESAAEQDVDLYPSVFARRVAREVARRSFLKAGRMVIIGDGARWIWNIAGTHYPEAIQIVDLYHAKGTVSEAAKAIFGPTSEAGQIWAKARRDELERGELDTVIDAFNRHADTSKEAGACRDYLERNRKRMNYPLFRSQGLCTSSGIVEAGCKGAIGVRLKQSGMHWSVRGSNAIIALRCCRLSGRYEDFWEWFSIPLPRVNPLVA